MLKPVKYNDLFFKITNYDTGIENSSKFFNGKENISHILGFCTPNTWNLTKILLKIATFFVCTKRYAMYWNLWKTIFRFLVYEKWSINKKLLSWAIRGVKRLTYFLRIIYQVDYFNSMFIVYLSVAQFCIWLFERTTRASDLQFAAKCGH